MNTLRTALSCLLLATLALLAGKAVFFLDQLSTVVSDAQSIIAQAGPQMVGATMEARQAAAELAAASADQRKYYQATGHALAIATVNAARLIEHTDQAVQNFDARTLPVLTAAGNLIAHTDASQAELTASAQSAIGNIGATADAMGAPIRDLDGELLALRKVTGDLDVQVNAVNPILANLTSMSSDGAEATAMAKKLALQALNPAKEPFWKYTVVWFGKQMLPLGARALFSRFFPERVVLQ
jgi:hypothetical protein